MQSDIPHVGETHISMQFTLSLSLFKEKKLRYKDHLIHSNI